MVIFGAYMALEPHYSQIMLPPTSKVAAGSAAMPIFSFTQLYFPLSALPGLPFRAIPRLIRVPRIPRRPPTSARRGMVGSLEEPECHGTGSTVCFEHDGYGSYDRSLQPWVTRVFFCAPLEEVFVLC